MEQDELRKLEEKCIQECAPTCTAACPVHVDVKAMLAEVGKGDFTAALKIFKKNVPFPGIICRICDQPCQDVCKYGEIGDAIAIRGLERACVEMGDPTADKSRPLPKRTGHVAIIGGGICGLTAAHDLARKGYAVTILEAGDRLGGSLWKTDRDYLPGPVIEHDLEIIEKLGVEVQLHTPINRELPDLRRQFDAVYIAVGPYTDESFDLALDSGSFIKVDPITFETSMPGVFAGGGLLWGMEMHSSVTSISEGRRAGISIDRYLQKVSLTASRVNEGPYTTCLFTSLEGVTPYPLIEPAEPGEGYEWHEAMQEAKRCLQCECMECVKVCEYLKHYERYPRRYLREIYNNLAIVKGTRYANQLINSCSLCGLCGEICPEHLDMGEVNLKARRAMVEQNRMPPSAHDFALRDMQFSNGDQYTLVRNAPRTTTSDYVLFPGCQLGGSAPEHVDKVYGYLREQLKDASVGLMLGCCGAPAYWAGQTGLFEATLAAWRENLRTMGNPTLVLPCSSCYQVFKSSLPEVELVSLWEIYAQHGLPAEAVPAPEGRTVAVHDPCTARHARDVQDSVRGIVQSLGYRIDELPLSRKRTTCCGYGGLMWLANSDLAKRVVKRRVEESTADYVTYCAMCRDFFAAQGKRALHLLDLIYDQGDDTHAARRSPGYSERHENRARLKRRLLKTVWGEDMDGQQPHESVRLIIAEDVQQRLDGRLILTEDIQRVIEYAERTGRRLLNRDKGHFLAYFKPHSVTFWVEYLPQQDGFVIFNAYSHRMEVPGSG